MEIKSPPKSTSTTNRLCFQYHPSEVPPKFQFHQLPSIELRNESNQLSPRQFPIEPQGPRRHWEAGWDQGMRCNIRFFVDKPIVRSDPPHLQFTPTFEDLTGCCKQSVCHKNGCVAGENDPEVQSDLKEEDKEEKLTSQEEKAGGKEEEEEEEKKVDGDSTEEGPLKGLSPEQINQLAIRAFYTSTTLRMTEEVCLPVPKVRAPNTTLERNADMVKYRPRRYDSGPAQWQEITPPVWDRLQERARIRPRLSYPGYPRPTPVTNTTAFCPIPPINRPRSGRSKVKEGGSNSVDAGITDLIKRERLTSTYVRQCPGYAGYRPRSPLRIPMENLNEPNLRMMTTMRASYRPKMFFPPINMDPFPHMGPMSRTVTLTYPYNPFSKVEKIRGSGRNDV